jgi:uncharacterized protein YjiS (DUF1127 family)
MTTHTESYTTGVAANTLDALLQQVRDWVKREALKQQLRQERRQLAEMSDAMLSDLGIDRAEALAEAARTDIPADRLNLQAR